MHTIDDLPVPQNHALEKSAALSAVIQDHISAAHGRLSFAQFMQLALYHPSLGYYHAADFDIGKQGDFITAPHISPLFAYCFAEQIQQLFSLMTHHNILELGAGTGQLAHDLLTRLAVLNASPTHYYIYEPSPTLREKQRQLLAAHSNVSWLQEIPETFNGIMIANEVLDALPVHCMQWQNNQPFEKYVAYEQGQFVWQLAPPSNEKLLQQASYLAENYQLNNGYTSEIHLALVDLVTTVAKSLQQGVILFVDYGYGQREYYHPERWHGTLSCFYRHLRHNNPLIYPGLQDITAHVDFTRVIEVAAGQDCDLAGFTTQSSFLLACGLTKLYDAMQHSLSAADEVNFHHKIKRLTLPTEMGECIKVMGLAKNLDHPLLGFALHNRGRDL